MKDKKMKIKLPTLTCQRCGHRWHPRVEKPYNCPKCRSPYWNTPRQRPWWGDKYKKREKNGATRHP